MSLQIQRWVYRTSFAAGLDLSMPLRMILAICLVVIAASPPAQTSAFRLSTYLGVADCDGIAAWHDDVFLACHSPQARLPIVARGSGPIPGMMNAYVLRIDTKAGKLVYATSLGGKGFTGAFRIKVDSQGFAYAVGFTQAPDFPTTPDAIQPRFGGGDSDGFLVKLTPKGRIVYSTFIGGGGADQGNGLALDGSGGVLVGGTTWSSNFPGVQKPHATTSGDAFVVYFRPGDRNSLRSTVFGGTAEEKLTGIAVDGKGGVFAVGYTKSKDFPLVAPIQSALRGVSDLFLVRLNLSDLSPTFSTFFGGSGDDSGWGVTVDRSGNPVVAGITNSSDLPAQKDAFQTSYRGGLDAFVAKFEGAGYRRVRVTYYGGAKDDSSGYDGDDLKVDGMGNVWLVGLTSSTDLPTLNAQQSVYGGGDSDGFLAVFSPTLRQLCYGTYYGGSDADLLEGVDVSSNGSVDVTGVTFSQDLSMSRRTIQGKIAPIFVAGKIANATIFVMRSGDPCHKSASPRR